MRHSSICPSLSNLWASLTPRHSNSARLVLLVISAAGCLAKIEFTQRQQSASAANQSWTYFRWFTNPNLATSRCTFDLLTIDCPLSSKTHPEAKSYFVSIPYGDAVLSIRIIWVLVGVAVVFRPEEIGISYQLSLSCPLCWSPIVALLWSDPRFAAARCGSAWLWIVGGLLLQARGRSCFLLWNSESNWLHFEPLVVVDLDSPGRA